MILNPLIYSINKLFFGRPMRGRIHLFYRNIGITAGVIIPAEVRKMEIRVLRYFLAVARERRVTKAATRRT